MKPKHRIFRSLLSENLLVQNSNGNARKISKICTNLRIKCSDIYIVKFGQILHFVLVLQLLSLNK